MSVVTRWRNTFSSSVTHLTVMSGFFAVKSLVNPCIRIMSPLLTVAIVRVVSATEGTETKSAAAPMRAPRTFLTVSSLCPVLSICPHVELMFTPERTLVKASAHDSARVTAACEYPLGFAMKDDRRGSGQNGARRCFVGDEPVDQAPGECGLDCRNLGLPDRSGDRRRLCRHLRGDTGQPPIGATLDEAALGIVGPTS